jgi:hypothetical protein
MTLSLCDQVTERVALGEPLAELSAHVETCTSCTRVVALSSQLGASRHAVDPGLGFSARMTVGAQHRIVVRRRHRVAAGLAATVASGAFAVFFVARAPADHTGPVVGAQLSKPEPTLAPEAPATDEDLAALVQMADVHRASRLSARWGHIKRPLRPYQHLIEGVTP